MTMTASSCAERHELRQLCHPRTKCAAKLPGVTQARVNLAERTALVMGVPPHKI